MCPSSTSSSDTGAPGIEDGALIDFADAETPRVYALALVALFLGVLVATALVDRTLSVQRPVPIGREAAAEARLVEAAKWSDGSRASLVERRLRQSSYVRSVAGPWFALTLLRVLGETPPHVLAGADGWLFLRARALPPRGAPVEAYARRTADVLAAFAGRARALGVELIVAPIPRKAYFYGAQLAESYDVHPELEGTLVDALRARDVQTVDLRSIATPSRQPADDLLYHPFGSHWTRLAEVLAAEAICEQARWTPAQGRGSTVQRVATAPPEADLIAVCGIDPAAALEVFPSESPADYFVLDAGGVPLVQPQLTRMPRIALSGTSFSAGRRLALFVGHFAQELVWDASRAAEQPLVGALELLRDEAKLGRPEVLLVELPVHYAFSRDLSDALAELYRTLPPAGPWVVATEAGLGVAAADVRTTLEASSPRTIQRRITLARVQLPGPAPAHAPWVLRLAGQLDGTPLEVSYDAGPIPYRAVWTPGEEEVLLPLLADPEDEIVIVARGPGAAATLRLDSLVLQRAE